MNLDELKKLGHIDEVLEALFEAAPKKLLDDAAHDALLDQLFSQIENFQETLFVPEEVLEAFKKELKDEEVIEMKNIDRIIDTAVKKMSKEEKVDLAKQVIIQKWYEENSSGDLVAFVENLNPTFWGLA